MSRHRKYFEVKRMGIAKMGMAGAGIDICLPKSFTTGAASQITFTEH